jgi:hypothetical protein
MHDAASCLALWKKNSSQNQQTFGVCTCIDKEKTTERIDCGCIVFSSISPFFCSPTPITAEATTMELSHLQISSHFGGINGGGDHNP